ncbi:hypothetical protein [Taklimakanibacter lacteus]|uniref:hypothetical protein n=1 Tax=Taklimakanibacter lacteus TaxID=2268456 RepID=UPI000E662C7E
MLLDCMHGKVEFSQIQVNIGFGVLIPLDFCNSVAPSDDEEKWDDGGTSSDAQFKRSEVASLHAAARALM